MSILNNNLIENVNDYSKKFETAKPFKHVEIPSFFEDSLVDEILEQFPVPKKEEMINEFGGRNQKYACHDVRNIGPAFRKIDDYIRSKSFQTFMRELTGIDDLLYDPEYHGAGTHDNMSGQGMDPHIDFNFHRTTGYHRRINAIIYLNDEWKESWGGCLQLHRNPWDPENDEIQTFLPLKNRCILFETNEYSWHGFESVRHPTNPNISRKSFTIYMYTKTRPLAETGDKHGTVYVPRPLPKHLVEGHTLSTDDLAELKTNFNKRNAMIHGMYEREARQNVVIKSMKAFRDNFQVPTMGFVQQLGPVSGILGNFGVGKSMSGTFKVHRPVSTVSYIFAIPEFIDNQSLTVFANGEEVLLNQNSERIEGGRVVMSGSFDQSLKQGESVDLEFRFNVSDSAFNTGKGMDKRNTAAFVRRLAFE